MGLYSRPPSPYRMEIPISHGLRNEMSKLLALNKFLRLDLFFVILKLYLRDIPFQARLLLAKRIVNVGLYLETYDF